MRFLRFLLSWLRCIRCPNGLCSWSCRWIRRCYGCTWTVLLAVVCVCINAVVSLSLWKVQGMGWYLRSKRCWGIWMGTWSVRWHRMRMRSTSSTPILQRSSVHQDIVRNPPRPQGCPFPRTMLGAIFQWYRLDFRCVERVHLGWCGMEATCIWWMRGRLRHECRPLIRLCLGRSACFLLLYNQRQIRFQRSGTASHRGWWIWSSCRCVSFKMLRSARSWYRVCTYKV